MTETPLRKYTVNIFDPRTGEHEERDVELTDEQVAELVKLGANLQPRKNAN